MSIAELERAFCDLDGSITAIQGRERVLIKQLHEAAIRYADFRARWFLADPAERHDIDEQRSLAHNCFIDACNALSRACGRQGLSQDWRAVWGDARTGEDRKRIGDFACFIAFQCMINAR